MGPVYHLYVPNLQGDPGELGLPGAVGAKVGTEPFTLLYSIKYAIENTEVRLENTEVRFVNKLNGLLKGSRFMYSTLQGTFLAISPTCSLMSSSSHPPANLQEVPGHQHGRVDFLCL